MFYYLSLAAALFAIGLYGVLARKDFPGQLISLFIMLNAVIVNLAAFNKFVQAESSTGLVLILFALIIFLIEFLLGAMMFYQFLSGWPPPEPGESVEIPK